MTRLSAVLTLSGTIVVSLAAQQLPSTVPPAPPTPAIAAPFAATQAPPVPARQGRPTTTPPAPPATAPAPKAAAASPSPDRMSLDPVQQVNVRVELAITESQVSGQATKKTVTLLTSGMNRGSVRSTLRTPGITMLLNVDARPTLLKDGRIVLYLNFQYVPEHIASTEIASAELNEEMAVILMDGKPLLVSQSADAKGDRKVTVEVTATIVK